MKKLATSSFNPFESKQKTTSDYEDLFLSDIGKYTPEDCSVQRNVCKPKSCDSFSNWKILSEHWFSTQHTKRSVRRARGCGKRSLRPPALRLPYGFSVWRPSLCHFGKDLRRTPSFAVLGKYCCRPILLPR